MKLYYDDAYIKEFNAAVTSCEKADGGYAVTLDQTAFYPEGGGQPYDTGTIGCSTVKSVRERGGNIVHYTNMPLETGASVNCKIDWERRFSFMQGHTGEHILSGIIKEHFGFDNVGFHMGSEFVTIDINGTLTDAQAEFAEKLANNAVYENIPVEASFKSGTVLDTLNYRSKLDLRDNVRIVHIAGYDSCACCGVHCRTTGEVGAVKIITRQKYKSGSRVFMLCGIAAMDDYAQKNKTAYEISSLLSAKPHEIANAVRQLIAEKENISASLYALKERRIAELAGKIPDNSGCIYHFEDNLSPDELRRLSLLMCERAQLAAVLSGENEAYKYAIASKHHDVRQITSALNSEFNGRGGGKSPLTQGSVTGAKENIGSFLSEQFKQFS